MSMQVKTSRDKWIEKDFQKNYASEEVMGLFLFALERPYCKIYFTSPELAVEFTNKLAEMYTNKLSSHLYFLQSNIERTYYTEVLMGEPTFDIERGIVYSISSLQHEKYFLEAYRMLIHVAEDMGIKTVTIKTKLVNSKEGQITYDEILQGRKKHSR